MTEQQKENVRKWVAALRSGKYEQGQKRLRSMSNKFCCLGVACDLYDPEKWVPIEDLDSVRHLGHGARPDFDVLDYFGLDEDTIIPLMQMNDAEGATFNQIADYIEAKLL